MSSNQYRNNRNSYRRKRRNEHRGLVALVTVTIMAAGIMGAYGVINLFTGGESGKAVTERTGSAVGMEGNVNNNQTSSTATSQIPSDNTGSVQSSSSNTSSNISSETDINGSVIAENNNNTKNNTTDSSEKTDIKELVTATKEAQETYYKGAVFVGDSRTQGLQINAGLKSPDFFAGRGLNVKNARTEKVVKNAKGQSVTVVDALKDKQYKKVYICYGINELGWPYTNVFANEYKKTIETIKKIQSDAEIVVCGILPVTEKKSKSDKIFNMKNVRKFNKAIKKMAEEIEVTYVDLSPAVANKKGFLPKDVTPDGVHMDREYCKRILAYIVNMNY